VGFFVVYKYRMPQFITPASLSGVGELTASTGLVIQNQGTWQFSQAGYNDGATFGVALGYPSGLLGPSDFYYGPRDPGRAPTQSAGELILRAQGWLIPGGNDLISYTDPITGITYPADACQITITGSWVVKREVNSNSYNSFGVERAGRTETDLGSRDMAPWLLSYTSPQASYVIQGSAVEGGAQDTFSGHEFRCRVTETADTDNSNLAFQSNTICRPSWIYMYVRRWQVPDLLSRVSQYRQTRS
jgi:hypothetical protein